jgi:hypothetical protein
MKMKDLRDYAQDWNVQEDDLKEVMQNAKSGDEEQARKEIIGLIDEMRTEVPSPTQPKIRFAPLHIR